MVKLWKKIFSVQKKRLKVHLLRGKTSDRQEAIVSARLGKWRYCSPTWESCRKKGCKSSCKFDKIRTSRIRNKSSTRPFWHSSNLFFLQFKRIHKEVYSYNKSLYWNHSLHACLCAALARRVGKRFFAISQGDNLSWRVYCCKTNADCFVSRSGLFIKLICDKTLTLDFILRRWSWNSQEEERQINIYVGYRGYKTQALCTRAPIFPLALFHSFVAYEFDWQKVRLTLVYKIAFNVSWMQFFTSSFLPFNEVDLTI